MMNIVQTQIVGLTMELEIKSREFRKLCKKLEILKNRNIEITEERYTELLKEFKKIYEKIVIIKEHLKELNDLNEKNEIKKQEMNEEIFKNNLSKTRVENEEKNNDNNISIVKYKENIFIKIRKWFSKIFKR